MISVVRKSVTRTVVTVGFILLLVGACYTATEPTNEDATVAFAPVARLALDSLKGANRVGLQFAVHESTRQWTRIRKSLGDLGYVVLACDRDGGTLIPFGALDLELSVVGRQGNISVEHEKDTPYGYSSDTYDVGLRFKPAADDEIRINIRSRSPEQLPQGELVIAPYWQWNAKDFLVGASLDEELRPYARRSVYSGIILLLAGAAIHVWPRARDRLTSRWSRRRNEL
jgi:hypothetical protein